METLTQPSVRERQSPLRKHYKTAPQDAQIIDRAYTAGGAELDPFHGTIIPGSQDYGIEWPFGIHHASESIEKISISFADSPNATN